jgi:hypothetical protein
MVSVTWSQYAQSAEVVAERRDDGADLGTER